MNENLPEINFKEKKEKKRGILGWLRGRLGVGSRGAMGEAGINPSAMNVGRALGTAKIGAGSAGLGGFLAGNAGLIATVAIVAVAGGLYVARNSSTLPQNNSSFSSGKTPDNYVPAILRSQAANQGSSLEMFKDTNKGAISLDENATASAANKQAEQKPEPAAAEGTADQGAPGEGGLSGDMAEKLQGAMGGSLTSSLGGGSNKFSGMGGFGNKFNSGSTGGKTGFTSIGNSFSAMPKFDQRKNKMLSMKGSYKPQVTSAKGGKYTSQGSKARNQLSAMRATQKSYTGNNIDSLRSTQDKAWEGTTPDGAADGGAGVSDGGAGIVNTPSLDNAGSSTGGGAEGDVSVPDASNPTDESPWKSLLASLKSQLMMAVMLSFVGYALIKLKNTPYIGGFLYALGMALCAAAIAMAMMVVVKAISLMKTEALIGSLYMLGGLATVGGAVGAMMEKPPTWLTPLWWLAGAGVLALITSMLS